MGTGRDADAVEITLGLIDASHTVHNGDCILRTSCYTITRSPTFLPINHYFHFASTYLARMSHTQSRNLNPKVLMGSRASIAVLSLDKVENSCSIV